MFKRLTDTIRRRPIVGWILFFAIMAGVFLLGLLAASITERRAEIATIYNNKKTDIPEFETRNEIWGLNFPREYETWAQTADTSFTSEFNGSHAVDVLAARPQMVIFWAGYSFSREYNSPRGHKHAIEDMRAILRTGNPGIDGEGDIQPATCWTCKGPDVPRMMHEMGIANFYKAPWSQLGAEIMNPIGCGDCHDPKTMDLKITRPALIEAFQRQGKDITKATPQEMRSLVCAQCHVEYYFKGEGQYLTFPWDKGMTMEDAEAYYDETDYYDYIHALSRDPSSRRSTLSMRLLNKASTRSAAWLAPTATCLTSRKVASSTPITTSPARCNTSTAPAKCATAKARRRSGRTSMNASARSTRCATSSRMSCCMPILRPSLLGRRALPKPRWHPC